MFSGRIYVHLFYCCLSRSRFHFFSLSRFQLVVSVIRFLSGFQLFFFFTRSVTRFSLVFTYSFFRVSVIRFFSRFQFFFSFSLVINLKAGASVDGVMEEPRPREPRGAVLAVDGRALSPGAR